MVHQHHYPSPQLVVDLHVGSRSSEAPYVIEKGEEEVVEHGRPRGELEEVSMGSEGLEKGDKGAIADFWSSVRPQRTHHVEGTLPQPFFPSTSISRITTLPKR